METNNKKRWIAAGIALLVFLVSVFTQNPNIENNTRVKDQISKQLGSMDEEILSGTNPTQKLFVLNVDGAIMTDDNNDYIIDKLKEAKDDPSCVGVIMHINSPGGSVYASERIAKEIEAVKEAGKPVYSVMRETAASGGYYISAPCDKIYASNETFTGSIGVIMQGYSLEGLFEKYGIKEQNITSGKMKDAGSLGRDMNKEEKEYLQELIDSAYGRFVKVVADGRDMSEADVRKIADGRIYDGAQAKEIGLVDEIGDIDDAIVDLTQSYSLNDPMVVEKNYYLNIFSSYFPSFSSKIDQPKSDLQIIKELMQENEMKPMYLYGGYYD